MSWSERGSCTPWHTSLITLLTTKPIASWSHADRAQLQQKERVNTTGEGFHSLTRPLLLPQILKGSVVLFLEVILDQLHQRGKKWKPLLPIVACQREHFVVVEEALGEGANHHPVIGER